MQRLAKRTIHRSLPCVTTAPFAIGARLYFLDAEHRPKILGGAADDHGKTASLRVRPGPGPNGARSARGAPGVAPTGSGAGGHDPGSDARSPESKVVGERRVGGGGPGTT